MNSSGSHTYNFENANIHSSTLTECLLQMAVDLRKSLASFSALASEIFSWIYLLNLTALWKSIAFKLSKSISSKIYSNFFFCSSLKILNAFSSGMRQLLKNLQINGKYILASILFYPGFEPFEFLTVVSLPCKTKNKIIYKLGRSHAKCKGVFPYAFLRSSPALKLKPCCASILSTSSWSFKAATCAAVLRA